MGNQVFVVVVQTFYMSRSCHCQIAQFNPVKAVFADFEQADKFLNRLASDYSSVKFAIEFVDHEQSTGEIRSLIVQHDDGMPYRVFTIIKEEVI